MSPKISESAAASIQFGKLVPGRVLARPNRFVVEVDTGRTRVLAHLADPGRLKELIFPGNLVMLKEHHGETARTTHKVVMARTESTDRENPSLIWVSVDTLYPNTLFEEAMLKGTLSEFGKFPEVRREVSLPVEDEKADQGNKPQGNKPTSRFDFLLGSTIVEVKSVTLCRDGTGLFPDAPTSRGARHVRELAQAKTRGFEAVVVFIAQREDVKIVVPYSEMDPEFAQAVAEVAAQGVKFLSYRCKVTPESITLLKGPVPVEIQTSPG